jgi:hypothetical protein
MQGFKKNKKIIGELSPQKSRNKLNLHEEKISKICPKKQ